MSSPARLQTIAVRHDGFGSRRFEQDGQFGHVEVLDLSTALATAAAEQAIRARAARLAEGDATMLARIVRIGRTGPTLSITSIAGGGVVPLGDLLAALEFGTVTLSDQAILELAGATARAIGAMHELRGSPVHGALTPGHVLVRRDGTVVLSGAFFGDALQALQCNREQFWRVFGVALPPSASLPRFDHRADVTQLGALVLAILLRRTLTATEYPKGILDLVAAATDALKIPMPSRTALLLWLQQTLQLHPKALFATAADAARAYDSIVADISGRRAGGLLLQGVVKQMSSDQGPDEMPSAPVRVASPIGAVDAAGPVAPGPRSLTFLRNVFPVLRPN
jgi:hypothetical protein